MSIPTPAFAIASPSCAFRGAAIPGVNVSPRAHHLHLAPAVRRVCMCQVPPEPAPDVPPSSPTPAATGPFSRAISWVKRVSIERGGQKAAALRNYGLAAVLSYGMFDALTYSLSFLFSLRAYLAAGKVLTWETLPQVLALMWGINNLSRPFRIAGAVALAPIVDRRVVKPCGRFLTRIRKGDTES